MEHQFWTDLWEKNETGFHVETANPLLVDHYPELSLAEHSRIFIPLCGKTLDIGWLLSRGHKVVGVELSSLAIDQLFVGLGIPPKISLIGNIKHYHARDIDIFVGDIFQLTKEIIGPVDAVFDRGALVALPKEMRSRYAKHVINLSDGAPQLLIAFEYDQALMEGPPFSIVPEEIDRHYRETYKPVRLATKDAASEFDAPFEIKENVWYLRPL
jgi:thiopurine S-methyltransferase